MHHSRPPSQTATTTSQPQPTSTELHTPLATFHQQHTHFHIRQLTAHIRQDVQKQLRQRLCHIVSPLAIQDTSQDSELTLYSSPQGRIFQVEYAQEAVKQGSVVVGIVSKTHAVLAAIKVHPIINHYTKNTPSNNTNSATQKSSHHTKRRSSPLTPTTALPSLVSPPMPASSPTSCANSPSPRA